MVAEMFSHHRSYLLLLVLLVSGAAGCARQAAVPATLNLVTRAGPTTRDPLATFDESSLVVFDNIFDHVVRYPPGPSGRRGVISSWMNPDRVTWELTVRRGLSFHDGSPVRAEDVAATLRRVLSDSSSPLHPFLNNVVMVEVAREGRVRVVTSGPVNLLLLLNFIPVVPEDGPLGPGGLPNGSGPYRAVHWSETRIELERSAPGPPREPDGGLVPRRVVLFVVADEEGEREAIESLDALILLTPSAGIVENAGALGLKQFTADALTAAYLVCNLREGMPTARLEVRRALAASIDRGKLGDVLPGEQVPASDVVPPGVFGWKPGRFRPDPSWRTPSAIPDEPLRFVVIESLKSVALEIARQLEEAGFGVEVSIRPVNEALEAMNRGEFDIAMIGYSCPTGNALEFFGFAFSGRQASGSGWNFSGYRNPRFDSLLEEASTSIDPAIQNDLLLDAGEVVIEDLPWIPLFSLKKTMLTSGDVTVSATRSGVIEFDTVRILR